MATTLNAKLLKGAMLTGVINAFINGGIQYFFLKTYSSIAISVDSITNNEDTVLGTSVTLSITLAMILTMVAYFGIKEKKVAFFPTAFWLTIKHGFFTFGVLTSLAVLWQKYAGTVEVSLISALIIIGVIAGIVSGMVNYLTLRECTLSERHKLYTA
ncbi:hypothetical protein [Psychrobacter immobilis]|uniref:hypothetical protein n=1 Tax=Psychrobacter TaxID=497 RepID=UPI0028EE53C8|nr:hypothetical protein [Psychrobacter immobilis]